MVETEVEYFVLDNGGQPFKVRISSSGVVSVYELVQDNNKDSREWSYNDAEPVGSWQAEYVFVGKSKNWGKEGDGNSILVHIRDPINPLKYLYIGECVATFTAPERILHFYSLIGNSSVPYPVARTVSFAIFLCFEHVYFPITNFKTVSSDDPAYTKAWADLYGERYRPGPDSDYAQSPGGTMARFKKTLKNWRVVRKRLF